MIFNRMALGAQDVFHFCFNKPTKPGAERGGEVEWVGNGETEFLGTNTTVVVGAQVLEQVPMCSGIYKRHCLHLRELLAKV